MGCGAACRERGQAWRCVLLACVVIKCVRMLLRVLMIYAIGPLFIPRLIYEWGRQE